VGSRLLCVFGYTIFDDLENTPGCLLLILCKTCAVHSAPTLRNDRYVTAVIGGEPAGARRLSPCLRYGYTSVPLPNRSSPSVLEVVQVRLPDMRDSWLQSLEERADTLDRRCLLPRRRPSPGLFTALRDRGNASY